jgi:adenylate kinase family enzyme
MSWEVVRASELDHIGHGWILANFPRPLAVAKAFAMLEEVEGKGQGQWFDWKSAMLASFVQHSAILQTKTGFVERC